MQLLNDMNYCYWFDSEEELVIVMLVDVNER